MILVNFNKTEGDWEIKTGASFLLSKLNEAGFVRMPA